MENNLNLGQHFLINENIIAKIIDIAQIKKNETILEIGAGNGVLSKLIAPKCKSLQIVEIDTRLKEYLTPIQNQFKNINISYTNALNFDFTKFKKIVTSLPYNIIEPFIKKCVREKVEHVIMLIGDKYALSLLSKNAPYSFLQTISQTFFECTLHDFVEKSAFSPPPRTGSYVVELKRKSNPISDLEFILTELFLQEDKKIKNALMESLIRLSATKNNLLTKKNAKSLILSLNIKSEILDKHLSNLNTDEFNSLITTLSSLKE